MDYVLNVYNGNEFLFAIGGKHMNYDNVIWWQLVELIKVVENSKCVNKEQLLKEIQEKAEYFKIVKDYEIEEASNLNIQDNTITVNHLQIYDFNDVNLYNCGRELVKVNSEYFIKYEGCDELFDVENIDFDITLLQKKVLTFNEVKEVASLIDGLLSLDKNDVIINNKKFLLLTEI